MRNEYRRISIATLTRPANTTAYASGQHVSNSTSAASADYLTIPLPREVRSLRAEKLTGLKSNLTNTNASFRLHILSALPEDDIADGDALSALTLASSEYYLGYFDFTFANTLGDFALVQAAPAVGDAVVLIPDDNEDVPNDIRNCYAVLEARAAYTPASGETFDLTLEGVAEIWTEADENA